MQKPTSQIRVGIDVGGTFTDFFLIQPDSRRQEIYKVPTTPDPAEGVMRGLQEFLDKLGLPTADVSFIAHGTTIATNAFLERRGAKTCLVTTEGFRDLLEIGRQVRGRLYDLHYTKPPSLVPRGWRLEASERIGPDGEVIKPLEKSEITRVLKQISEEGYEAVAVCLLFSFKNPSHERLLAEALREHDESLFYSVSHEVSPEFREYERLSTTVLNAYVGPKVATYLGHLEKRCAEAKLPTLPYIVQSNGGLISMESAARFPVRTALSGPAAGVTGARFVADQAGFRSIVTLDMGGTSTDMAIFAEDQNDLATVRDLEGYPVQIPMLDIHTIGAGGGSIAAVDDAGLLTVGPHSAGSVPGPACYGKGGDQATLTDAHVQIGTLNVDRPLGGQITLSAERTQDVIDKLAQRLGMSAVETAEGILRVAISHLVGAMRVKFAARGLDPRQFTLVTFGGAGPLHASLVARELNIPRVLVPATPGVLSALGMVAADLRREFSITRVERATPSAMPAIRDEFQRLVDEARAWISDEGLSPDDPDSVTFEMLADMRYLGQNHEIMVSAPESALDDETWRAIILRNFHERHEQVFGYSVPDEEVQFVTLRVIARGRIRDSRFEQPALPSRSGDPYIGSRDVYLHGRYESFGIYERSNLRPGDELTGPAVVEQVDSTVLILPSQRVTVDSHLNLVVEEC